MGHYKNSTGIFHKNRKNNPKICMEPQKTRTSQGSLEKEEQTWKHHTPWFQTMLQAIVIKIVLYWLADK